jgi:hypothetical protein
MRGHFQALFAGEGGAEDFAGIEIWLYWEVNAGPM